MDYREMHSFYTKKDSLIAILHVAFYMFLITLSGLIIRNMEVNMLYLFDIRQLLTFGILGFAIPVLFVFFIMYIQKQKFNTVGLTKKMALNLQQLG